MTNSGPWVYTPGGRRPLSIPVEQRNPDLIATLLRNRNIKEEDEEGFLNPTLEALTPWREWEEAALVVSRLSSAVRNGERIHIHSDYDVDGITSLVMMKAVLERLGVSLSWTIPNRFEEGYGLHVSHVERALCEKASLLVTLDNGSEANGPVSYALEQGLDVVIVDHHQCKEAQPGTVTCNPVLSAPLSCSSLAAAGITMKICQGVAEEAELDFPAESLLRLAALGTLCDQVPLKLENRLIAALGLKALSSPTNPFLTALFNGSGIRGEPAATDITFRIGPKINAAGRLGVADSVVESFFTINPREARERARNLDSLNAQRQVLQADVIRSVMNQVNGNEPGIVLSDPDWHYGVLGIAASKVAETAGVPAILLTEQGGLLKGSGRSVDGFDLHSAVLPLRDHLDSFGGHARAIGLSLYPEALETFTEGFQKVVSGRKVEIGECEISVDMMLLFDELTKEAISDLNKLEPHGAGNSAPLFYTPDVIIEGSPQPFGKEKNHLKMVVRQNQKSIPAVFWNGLAGGEIPAECGIVYNLDSSWNQTRLNVVGFVMP